MPQHDAKPEGHPTASEPKSSLLVVELWGLGDLVIASPFLQAATERYQVTLLAKPYATDLHHRFWPAVKVEPFVAPWTSFRRKYRIYAWPWGEMLRLRRASAGRFDIGLSGRWDPRDHLLLRVLGVRRRLGFSRLNSRVFLTDPLPRPEPTAHRYEYWRTLGRALGLALPPREKLPVGLPLGRSKILVHTGAGQAIRVWPLERYARIALRLRQLGNPVQIACDPDQRAWWLEMGESDVATPRSVAELMNIIDESAVVMGNDSGPSHLAALCGVPTFTVFGPQLPEWFAPLHPLGETVEGKPCPYKPCSDYCRFPVPYCMLDNTEAEVWERMNRFLAARRPPPASGSIVSPSPSA